LLSALVLSPFAVLGAVFVPAYWQPDHQFTFIRGVGIEDVLFCFACGGMSWLFGGAMTGTRNPIRIHATRFIFRLACWAGVALIAIFVALLAGCEILLAVILGFTISCIARLSQSHRASRLILAGALGFTAVYACVSWLVLAVLPQSAGFWVG